MRQALAIVLMSMWIGACSGSSLPTTSASPTSAEAIITTTSTILSVVEETDGDVPGPFERALAATLTDGNYQFGGELVLHSDGSSLPVNLYGWVDGPDRSVVLETPSGTVETLVVDGQAVRIKDGESTPIPLTEAGLAPSLTILRSADLETETRTQASGVIPAAMISVVNDAAASGFVDITIWYTDQIVAYKMDDPGGAWSLEMTFSE